MIQIFINNKCYLRVNPFVSRQVKPERRGVMAWRRYPIESIWHEMDEMRAEPDCMFRQVSARGKLLQAAGLNDRLLQVIRGEFRMDVRKHDNEVIVVADLPGIDKVAVFLQLQNPQAPEIVCERRDEREKKDAGFACRNACPVP
jgi:HSP20 family protein